MRYFFGCCVVLLSLSLRAQAAPELAEKQMPAGAISLRWQQLPTGANSSVWLHLYCVPKGRAPELKGMGIEKSGPITRADIFVGPSLIESPFWLDIFADTGAKRRLNSVKFEETQDVSQIVLRWLEPQKRRGPVLLLEFGYTHWHEWQSFTFADGWNRPAHWQRFLYGGEGEIYNSLRFDRTDGQGRLIVTENEGRENGRERTNIYRWNGREWDDETLKYFVVGASLPTKSAAEQFAKKRGYGEVLRSDDYPKLRPGYWIWVANRSRTQAEASEVAQEIKRQGNSATVRLAR